MMLRRYHKVVSTPVTTVEALAKPVDVSTEKQKVETTKKTRKTKSKED